MTIRTDQIASVLQRTISEVLARDMSDPRIVGMVSITRVEVTTDLKLAKVYVSIMPRQYEKRTLAGLQHADKHIQSKVLKRVHMRAVPHLDFRIDESLKKQAEVYAAISEGLKRTGPQETDEQGQAPEEPGDSQS